MRSWLLLCIGMGAYALALLFTAPATLIDAALKQASQDRLRLAEARGTLWSGSGQVEFRDAARQAGIAKNVLWRVRPVYLLRGQLRCEVEFDQSDRRFPVTISRSQIEFADADISLPAAALGLSIPKLAPLGLTGDLLLRIAHLSLRRDAVHGNATLLWRAAGSAYTPVSPLGDYELRFEGEGSGGRAVLRTLQGPIQLDGQGSWKIGVHPVFSGTARVPPQHLQQLAPLLRLIAIERGDGVFELRINSRQFGFRDPAGTGASAHLVSAGNAGSGATRRGAVARYP